VDAFLTDIFNGNVELIDYLQRMYGYALNGRTSEEICVFNLGKGGK
jgi:phage/plasmid-associated DNA primase